MSRGRPPIPNDPNRCGTTAAPRKTTTVPRIYTQLQRMGDFFTDATPAARGEIVRRLLTEAAS